MYQIVHVNHYPEVDFFVFVYVSVYVCELLFSSLFAFLKSYYVCVIVIAGCSLLSEIS